MNTVYYKSPIGLLMICEEKGEIVRISYVERKTEKEEDTLLLRETIKQMKRYFQGNLKSFRLPLNPHGTDFQKKVWTALLEIPYGETVSYKEIAEKIESPKACRAVGMANNKNPIMIVVPCHRVVGHNGKMVGYACGISIKEELLRLEAENK